MDERAVDATTMEQEGMNPTEGETAVAAVEANQAGTQESTGPRLEVVKPEAPLSEGLDAGLKAVTPWPYTREFRQSLEPLGEDPAQFDELRLGFFASFQPEDTVEAEMVEDLVELRWKRRRLMRAHDTKLIEIRRRKEVERQRRLLTEDKGLKGSYEKIIMTGHGIASISDCPYKFKLLLSFLGALRASVDREGFGEGG
jgi:hypothetical protein